MKLPITWHRLSLLGFLSVIIVFWLWSGFILGLRYPSTNRLRIQTSDRIITDTVDSNPCLVKLLQENYPEALIECQQVMESDAGNLEAHLNLGLAYYHLEKYQQAIAEYQLVIQQNPDDYRAFYNLGLVYAAKSAYQPALENYRLALKSSLPIAEPQKALIYNDLGAVYILLANYSEAISNLNRAIQLDSHNHASYFNRGCAHHRQKDYLAGIKDFTSVIELDPNYTQAYVSRAILNHLLRHEQAAYADIDLALQQYQAQNDQTSYQKVLGLKNSMIESRIHQLA